MIHDDVALGAPCNAPQVAMREIRRLLPHLCIEGCDAEATLQLPCRECDAGSALILIGTHRHDVPLPLRWLRAFLSVRITRVYVCSVCGDVVTVTA